MKLEIGFSIIAINLVLGCTLSEIPDGDRCPEFGVISDVKVYIYKDGAEQPGEFLKDEHCPDDAPVCGEFSLGSEHFGHYFCMEDCSRQYCQNCGDKRLKPCNGKCIGPDDECKGTYDAPCKVGAVLCLDGESAIKVCDNKGQWLDTTCDGMGILGGRCQNNNCVVEMPNPEPVCTGLTYDCSDNILKQCVEGQWKNVLDCTGKVCNATTGKCEETTNPGPEPDPTCDNLVNTGGNEGDCCDAKTYKPTCIHNRANALVCRDGKVAQWACDKNQCSLNGNTVVCPTPGSASAEACTATSIVKCDNACSEDKLTMWYWNGTKVVEKKCKEATCVPNDPKSCVADSTGEDTRPPCTATSTTTCEVACKADKSEGYYWSGGKVNVVVCENKNCQVDSSSHVACKSDDTTTDPSVGSACDNDSYKASCINGGAYALVCGSNNKVQQWMCDKNQCTPNGSTANCPKGSTTPEACTGDDYTGTCAADKKTATVCVKGETKNYTCFKDICETRKDGTIYCPKDQQAIDNEEARKACEDKEQIKEGGKVGDCCDTDNYKPDGCDDATNSGLRCSNGVIVEWTCIKTKKCKFDPENTAYPGGKYSCE